MVNKICIIPDLPNSYNIKMVADLSLALRQIGYCAHYHLTPVKDQNLNRFVKKYNFNTIIRINKLPPAGDKRHNNYRHISWVQDVFPSLVVNDNLFQANDLICTLGCKNTLGLKVKEKRYAGPFNLYINPRDFSSIKPKYGRQQYDANLVGFIPLVPWAAHLKNVEELNFNAPLSMIQNQRKVHLIRPVLGQIKREIKRYFSRVFGHILTRNQMAHLSRDQEERFPLEVQIGLHVEEKYKILTGSLDLDELYSSLLDAFGPEKIENHPDVVDFCIRELPRFLDRYLLAKEMMEVTQNFVLCGNNWEFYGLFESLTNGPIPLEDCPALFSNSKLTLQNNNHGIGVHSRTLSAMASGGFVFTHRSHRDELPGGINTLFEPNIHYGSFHQQNLFEEANRWLSSDNERNIVAERARKLVLTEMTWQNGALHLAKLVDLRP